jgi:hypothetical protein
MMVGSNAVIGLPDEDSENKVGKYVLGGYATELVALSTSQTLISKDLMQNDTHTVMSFTKLLEESNEVTVNPNGDNNFLVSTGTTNELAYHAARHSFTETITTAAAGCGAGCDAGKSTLIR